MQLKEMLLECKRQGISIKYIADQTEIKVSTLYAFSSGQRNLSTEKQNKLSNFLNIYFSKGENNNNGNKN